MVVFNHTIALLLLVQTCGKIAVVASVAVRSLPLAAEDSVQAPAVDVAELSSDDSSLLQVERLKVPQAPRAPQVTSDHAGSPIPHQLVMTAKQASLSEMSQAVQDNVKRMLTDSPEMHLRWLSDTDCAAYIHEHYDTELSNMFKGERRGSFRGDICRSAVLAQEGGFYLDLDVQLYVPVTELVDDSTTFASSFTADNRILNAVIATRPGNPVMLETLDQIRKWYRNEVTRTNWMGPETMLRALRSVVDKECKGHSIDPSTGLEWKCGPQVFRFYQEQPLRCDLEGSAECPPARAQSSFEGLRYGLFTPGDERRLVAWPRFASCSDWGCGAGGWDVRTGAVASAAAF